jgi:hypothetical protein
MRQFLENARRLPLDKLSPIKVEWTLTPRSAARVSAWGRNPGREYTARMLQIYNDKTKNSFKMMIALAVNPMAAQVISVTQ